MKKAARFAAGELRGADASFDGVSSDTRTLQAGELFIALSGPNFDGTAFVVEAQRKGAAGAIVREFVNAELPQIRVDDTRLALGKLAAAWRQEMPAKVIGITGSNGKTTLKELVAACVSRVVPTIATHGNLNNEIGLPLMLLRIRPEHEVAVLEMGANHIGEIGYLTSLARPAVVTITNAGTAHLEGFGSVEGIARGKGEILDGDPRPEVAVLNADDAYYAYWRTRVTDLDVISFGLSERADVWGDKIRDDAAGMRFRLHLPDDTLAVYLPLAGAHNVRNACAAAAIATALRVPAEEVVAGLESVRPVAGRLQALGGAAGSTLYDDSYNANPESVLAAGRFLAALDGRNWLVLGDMFELGAEAVAMHADVGSQLREIGIEHLFTLGELAGHAAEAFGPDATAFDSIQSLIDHVLGAIDADVNVLVKGSRGMRMERVVDALRDAPAVAQGGC